MVHCVCRLHPPGKKVPSHKAFYPQQQNGLGILPNKRALFPERVLERFPGWAVLVAAMPPCKTKNDCVLSRAEGMETHSIFREPMMFRAPGEMRATWCQKRC